MSLVAGLLSFVSVIVLIMFLAFHAKNGAAMIAAKSVAKVLIFAMLIYFPYTIGQKKDILAPYPVLESFKGSAYDPYMKTLNWLLVVEAFNYNGIYSLIMSTGLIDSVEDDYKAKQVMHSVARELRGLNKSAKEKYLQQ